MIQLFDLATKYSEVRFSPFCWRIKYALAHKGLKWDESPLSFAEMKQLPLPNDGKVPVLVDGDEVVFDSGRSHFFLIINIHNTSCLTVMSPDRNLYL